MVGIVVRVGLTCVAVALGSLVLAVGGQAGKSNATYGIASEVIKGFGTTDTNVASKRPSKYVLGTSGRTFVTAKLRKFKNWGSKKTKAKAKKLSICDVSNSGNCSTTKKGSVTFKSPRKAECEVKPGQSKQVWLYAEMTAKQPPHKGHRKGRKFGVLFAPPGKPPQAPSCPEFF